MDHAELAMKRHERAMQPIKRPRRAAEFAYETPPNGHELLQGPFLDASLVLKWPVFKAFRDFQRSNCKNMSSQMGRQHPRWHPKWFRNNFEMFYLCIPQDDCWTCWLFKGVSLHFMAISSCFITVS